MKVHWWKGVPNFGDALNEFIVKQMGVDHEWSRPEDAELVIAGSVLEELPDYWTGTVCGAGKRHERSRIHLSDARVFALRGKLTQAGVTGLHGQKPVLGDPGLLAPMFVRQPSAKHDLGVLPHWRDSELLGRFPYGKHIDPRQPVEKVLEEIASCRRIITSSLHGAIVADAYGIPRQLELPDVPFAQEGGDFKYKDYASVYGTHPHFGEMWLAPIDLVQEIREALYAALLIALGIDLSEESRRHPQISLLVPFRDDGEHRGRVWKWLRRYWRTVLPEAEIIQGHDHGSPFSKSAAVNHAARHARGRIFAVIDADVYLPASSVTGIADDIEKALHANTRKWYMPYTDSYRLSEKYTKQLLGTSPGVPLPLPPHASSLEDVPEAHGYGHKYGAFAQVMPREAFGLVEGMDPRFRGWGCEDGALLRSIDTLYAQHEVFPAPVAHLWHAKSGAGAKKQWVGQNWASANSALYDRYVRATAEPAAMRGLANEHTLGWAHDMVEIADGDSV